MLMKDSISEHLICRSRVGPAKPITSRIGSPAEQSVLHYVVGSVHTVIFTLGCAFLFAFINNIPVLNNKIQAYSSRYECVYLDFCGSISSGTSQTFFLGK